MKIPFLTLLALASTLILATAGSGTAELRCKSGSGRTTFSADLQDITGLLEKATLTVDGARLDFSGDDARLVSIFDPRNGVFTLQIEGKTNTAFPNHRYVTFWAIPSSFKTISSSSGNQSYKFRALLFGTEPRKDKDVFITPQIEVECTLVYEI